MPKVNSFKVSIQTGNNGIAEPVLFNFNSHKMPFNNIEGSVESGQSFSGDFDVQSFCHSLTLVGPDSGTWDIESISVEFVCDGEQPYSVNYGAVILDETTEVNLWRGPPAKSFVV